jgi:glycosyltransferase involved in cell wall biosynthesis
VTERPGPVDVARSPTLSVLICCRDEAELLPLQLSALAGQEVEGWIETIIVDDGSTDGTHTEAEAHGRGLPGLQVIRRPPTNHATALNVGIGASTGEAIVLLDGDDEVAPGYLAAFRRALTRHPFVAATRDQQALNPPWMWGSRPQRQLNELGYEPQLPWPVAGTGTLGLRREVIAAVGGFDEALGYAEDTDLCWRIAQQGIALVLVPEAVLHYRLRPTAHQTFSQARGYGRGGALLDYRFGAGPSPKRVAKRMVGLAAVALRLPFCVRRSVRVATAFRAGNLVGWLEAALRPLWFFPAEVLVPVVTEVEAPAGGPI